ncbi:WXG100 family type VII secretion target [Nocardia brasiliensis]|uniref:WXG100 family type VII secretion target n=1 Tax=Nocardia brasiliensis TaxID=37326 RepID=UPI002453F35D|nr:WXG100 family type VII secretion target [Nocardia brasiliensis]
MAHTYDLEQMAQFVTRLDGQIAQLQDICDGIQRSAATVRSQFIGAGAEGFAIKHTEWQTEVADELAKLQALREKVHLAQRNYAEAERLNREMLGFAEQ